MFCWTTLSSCQTRASSPACWSCMIKETYVSEYKILFLFFQIVQSIHEIYFLCNNGRDSSDILWIERERERERVNNFTRLRFANCKMGGNPAMSHASWAVPHLNNTCSIDSVPTIQSLHWVTRFIPWVFNLSATASAPDAASQRKLRILGKVEDSKYLSSSQVSMRFSYLFAVLVIL